MNMTYLLVNEKCIKDYFAYQRAKALPGKIKATDIFHT